MTGHLRSLAFVRNKAYASAPERAGHRRIAAVPFTLRNLKEDLEDVGSNFDGAADLEFRLATDALQLEQSGLGYQRVPPGYRFPYGHTHETQEEVYVVVRGSGRMKLDDEIIELKEWDAVRVPPGTWRGYEAGPDGLEIIVIGAPSLGDARREDVEGRRDWWTGERRRRPWPRCPWRERAAGRVCVACSPAASSSRERPSSVPIFAISRS